MLKSTSLGWAAFAAALTALAAVLTNMAAVWDFIDRVRGSRPLNLAISYLGVRESFLPRPRDHPSEPPNRITSGTPPPAEREYFVSFTITKNIDATGRNCGARLDTREPVERFHSHTSFDLPRGVQNDRRTFEFVALHDSDLAIRLICDGAVSNELRSSASDRNKP
jgi:hypothetical protein